MGNSSAGKDHDLSFLVEYDNCNTPQVVLEMGNSSAGNDHDLSFLVEYDNCNTPQVVLEMATPQQVMKNISIFCILIEDVWIFLD